MRQEYSLTYVVLPTGLLITGAFMLAVSAKRRRLLVSEGVLAAMFVGSSLAFFAQHFGVITTYQCATANVVMVIGASIVLLVATMRSTSRSEFLSGAVQRQGNRQSREIYRKEQVSKED